MVIERVWADLLLNLPDSCLFINFKNWYFTTLDFFFFLVKSIMSTAAASSSKPKTTTKPPAAAKSGITTTASAKGMDKETSGPKSKIVKPKLKPTKVAVQLWDTKGHQYQKSVLLYSEDFERVDVVELTQDDGTVTKIPGPFKEIRLAKKAPRKVDQAELVFTRMYDGKLICEGVRYFEPKSE